MRSCEGFAFGSDKADFAACVQEKPQPLGVDEMKGKYVVKQRDKYSNITILIISFT
jgi:hypothetical protein